MPRRARVIFPRLPHHVTRRGNHQERVFFSPGDQETYLSLLREHSKLCSIDVAAYCLMTNHVHLVVVPSSQDALHRALKAVHGQYAQRMNRMRGQKGHLWQGRYFSSALDNRHFLNAVRYVELNPVKAGLVLKPTDYPWSSSAGHCGIRADPNIRPSRYFRALAGIDDWPRWLAEGVEDDFPETLCRSMSQNLPCGSPEFIGRLERQVGRRLSYESQGGDRKSATYKEKDAALGGEAPFPIALVQK